MKIINRQLNNFAAMDNQCSVEAIIKRNLEAYELIAEEFANRYFYAQLDDELERFSKYLPPNSKVIDIGCGVGRDLLQLCSRGFKPIGLDISSAMLQVARNRGVASPLIIGNMGCLPLSSKSVDGAWVCASLLHFPKAKILPILAEIDRITRRTLFVSVIEGSGVRWSKEKDGKSRFFLLLSGE